MFTARVRTICAALFVFVLAMWLAPWSAVGLSEALVGDAPNVLVIVTDDQRLQGTMFAMPATLALFDQGGTEFTRPYVATPLCCPDRGSLRSGRYAHNHGVLTNWSPEAQQAYDQTKTIESQLRTAGYSTAIVGKYWNDWPLAQSPPNWDKWATFSGGYNNMTFNVNGTTRQVTGYTTTLLGTYADQFLTGFEANDPKPWYLYVAPQAPHSPITPEPKYSATPIPNMGLSPAVTETDRSDKPPWVRGIGHLYTAAEVNNTMKGQDRTLMSVDDIIGALFSRLAALGETNTLAFFTSDNGYMWGEHGLDAKRWPYTDSIKVPIYMRWPGHVAAGVDDSRLVSLIDFAPTIYEAVGVTPTYVPDGVSLFAPGGRDHLFVEYFQSPDYMTPRTWVSIVTPTIQYVEWYENGATTFREYYDLVADPYQLVNLLGDSNPSNNPDVTGLSAQLALDRVCIGLACPQPVISVLDTQPPGAPGTPVAASTVPGQVSLTWAAADDDVSSSIIYRVYRDGGTVAIGSLVSSSTTTVSFIDTGSAPGTVHTYSVEAVDQAGNVGPRTPESDPVTVLVPPPPPPNIFATDFSAGLGGWTTVSGLTIDNTIGSVAAPSAHAQVNSAKAFADKTLPAPHNEVCVSANFNLASIGTGQTVSLIHLRRPGSALIGQVYVNGTRQLKLRNDLTFVQFNPSATLPTGWHRIELCGRIGTSGELRLYTDGLLRATWVSNLGTGLIAGVQIFENANRVFTANVDDVVVDQAAG